MALSVKNVIAFPARFICCRYRLLHIQKQLIAAKRKWVLIKNLLLDFSGTAGDICSLIFNLVHSAEKLGMLDKDVLCCK